MRRRMDTPARRVRAKSPAAPERGCIGAAACHSYKNHPPCRSHAGPPPLPPSGRPTEPTRETPPMPSQALVALVALLGAARLPAADAPRPVDYSREVQPILTAHCYACHGPDEGQRKAKLRLDVRDSAVKKAIRPGDAAHSPLVERILSKDPEEVMPPPGKKEPLSAAQIDVLRRWIDQGAKFDIHWAYVKPTRPALPSFNRDPKGSVRRAWVRNPVDAFVAAGQEAHGFSAAPEADRVTLIRRLSFDLIGL